MLYVARAAEQQAGKQLSPSDYTGALVDSVMGTDAVGLFVEAMTLTRRRQDLAPLVERTVERLHAEGLRAYAAEMAAAAGSRGSTRNQRAALLDHRDGRHPGRPGDGPLPADLAAEMLRLLGPADARPRPRSSGVSPAGNPAPGGPSTGKEEAS